MQTAEFKQALQVLADFERDSRKLQSDLNNAYSALEETTKLLAGLASLYRESMGEENFKAATQLSERAAVLLGHRE
jgi:hypothetical protein